MILMINTMKIRLILSFVLLIYSLVCQADGGKDSYIFRKVDYQQGLSNSAVLCLFKTIQGWCGSVLTMVSIVMTAEAWKFSVPIFQLPRLLSNNVIHSIQQADNNCLWISTHLGIIVFHRIHGKLSDIMTLQMIIIYIPILKETHGWWVMVEFSTIIHLINDLYRLRIWKYP